MTSAVDRVKLEPKALEAAFAAYMSAPGVGNAHLTERPLDVQMRSAITAYLAAALAPVEAEPHAWMGYWPGAGSVNSETHTTHSRPRAEAWRRDGVEVTPLYTHPNPSPSAAGEGWLVKHMVSRFLSWKLPDNFSPDGGISFKAMFNENTPHPRKAEPTGTNLFDATQARAMVLHMLGGVSHDFSELERRNLSREQLDAATGPDTQPRITDEYTQKRIDEERSRCASFCDAFDSPVSTSDFVNGQATAAQQIRAAILGGGLPKIFWPAALDRKNGQRVSQVTDEEAVYGLLWQMHTTDATIHACRRALLDKITREGQRRGITWARETFGESTSPTPPPTGEREAALEDGKP